MTVSFRHKDKHKRALQIYAQDKNRCQVACITMFVDGAKEQGSNARDDAVRRVMNWDGLGPCFLLEPGVVTEIPRWEATGVPCRPSALSALSTGLGFNKHHSTIFIAHNVVLQ